MLRRYRRRYISVPRKLTKYSNETFAGLYTYDLGNQATGYQGQIVFTASSSILGTRKAKNFTLDITCDSVMPFMFALVFVPEGTAANNLNLTTGPGTGGTSMPSVSIYEPNQNVIMSGIFGGTDTNTQRFYSRLARNLNSGDSIVLVFHSLTAGSGNAVVCAKLNYAISY